MIGITEVKAIKESLIDKMKEVFFKLGSIEPMGIVVDKDGTIAFVPMPYKDNTEKKIMTDLLKNICRRHTPAAVCIVNEAWAVKNVDNKKEIAMMIFETNFNKEMICFDIDRKNKALINESRTDKFESDNFSNLLIPVDQN